MQQTTGKLSFAEVEDELRELLGRSPSCVEMFDACYTDSNGNPSNNAAGDALAQMKEHQSKLLPDTQDNVDPDDLFAKVRGKDPHGRVRMLGLGVNPSDMWGGIPSRSACYRMVLENQVALERMEEKMDRAFADFQQKMQQQTFTLPPPTSLVQPSNSISVGNRHQVGGSVLLKIVFYSSKIVAKGFIRSVDPNQKVGGRQLESNWYEGEISKPVDWDEDLIRPNSYISTIGEAFGICVAWPGNLLYVVALNITRWSRGNDLYNILLARAQASLVEGESNCNETYDAEQYKSRFEQFIADVRSDLLLPMLPVIEVAITSGGKPELREILRKGQLEVPSEVPKVKCVDAKGLEIGPDRLHLTTKAQVQLGQMLAHAFCNTPN